MSQQNVIDKDFKFNNQDCALLFPRNQVSWLVMLLPLGEEDIPRLLPEFIRNFKYWEMFTIALGVQKNYMGR